MIIFIIIIIIIFLFKLRETYGSFSVLIKKYKKLNNFLLFTNKSNIIEHYDTLIKNINSSSTCSDICTGIYGCAGFAHNNTNKDCYISKNLITKPPVFTSYYYNFDNNDYICNKDIPLRSIGDISSIYDNINNYNKEKNKLYKCIDENNNINDVYFNNNINYDVNNFIFPSYKTESYFDNVEYISDYSTAYYDTQNNLKTKTNFITSVNNELTYKENTNKIKPSIIKFDFTNKIDDSNLE